MIERRLESFLAEVLFLAFDSSNLGLELPQFTLVVLLNRDLLALRYRLRRLIRLPEKDLVLNLALPGLGIRGVSLEHLVKHADSSLVLALLVETQSYVVEDGRLELSVDPELPGLKVLAMLVG